MCILSQHRFMYKNVQLTNEKILYNPNKSEL